MNPTVAVPRRPLDPKHLTGRVARETPTVSPPWSGAHPRQAAARSSLERSRPGVIPRLCRRRRMVTPRMGELGQQHPVPGHIHQRGGNPRWITYLQDGPLNHPNGTGDGSKASILVHTRSTSRSPGTYGRIGSTFRPILEPPAPISFASVDPRDRSVACRSVEFGF